MFLTNPKFYWQMMAEESEGGGDSGDVDTGDASADVSDSVDSGTTDGDAGGSVDSATERAWADNWREEFAGGDEAIAKRLGRYATPREATKALIAAQNKIRSGELASPFPADGTEAEQQAWRQEHGIPETPDKYDLSFESGLVIGDEDKATVDSFLENVAHKHNLPPDVAKSAVEWWYDQQQAQLDAIQEADIQARDRAADELNSEWGGEYRGNINRVKAVLGQFPESVQDALMSARAPDGTALLNNPDILRGFVNISHELDPAGTITPMGMGDPMKSVNDEIATIEKTMRENRREYNKDEKMQARYRDLINAREKLEKRAS